MLLLFLISVFINFKSITKDYDSSFIQPYFAYFNQGLEGSSQIKEIWEQFVEKYKDDDSITLAELNCNTELKYLCQIQLQQDVFNTIAAVRRSIAYPLENINSLEDLEKELIVEENFDRSRLCRAYPSETYIYPYIIYNTTSNYSAACEDVMASYPELDNAYKYVYLQRAREEGLYIKTGIDSFEIEGGPTQENLKYAISEFKTSQMQEIPIQDALKTKRRLAYFVSNIISDIYMYQMDSILITNKTFVCRITAGDFNSELGNVSYINETSDLPALVLFSEKKDKFTTIKNLNKVKKNVTDIFNDHADGKYDNEMIFNIHSIDEKGGKNTTKYAILFVSFVMIASFAFVLFRRLLCKNAASGQSINKIE